MFDSVWGSGGNLCTCLRDIFTKWTFENMLEFWALQKVPSKRCLQKAVIFTKRSPTWHECCRSCDVWIAWLGQIEWRNMPIWKTHHKNAQNDLCKQIFLILHSISVCWLSSNWQRLAYQLYQLYKGLEPDISTSVSAMIWWKIKRNVL